MQDFSAIFYKTLRKISVKIVLFGGHCLYRIFVVRGAGIHSGVDLSTLYRFKGYWRI